MTIKEYYLKNFSTDELGLEINENSTFAGILHKLLIDQCPYEYIGVSDSLVRERVFERLAEEIEMPYDFVYKLWIK
jgi:hypothetical protein